MSDSFPAVYPLLWSDDVGVIADWLVRCLGFTEVWRSPDAKQSVEHAELAWQNGRVSINVKSAQYAGAGPAGIAVRVAENAEVDRLFALATGQGAEIVQNLLDSPVAYSFTAADPDGNSWWVHAETGFLDQLR
ncbi:MAG: VOC family protein [Pseudomonadota bacterium]